MDWCDGGLLVQDALTLCNSFAQWSICHVKGGYNEAVHALAKDAISCENDVVDLVSIPHCVIGVVQQDIVT